MSRRKRTRFIGSYREPPSPPIDLPFTIDSFVSLLHEGTRLDARYTHQQIKDWADRFWWTESERPFALGIEVSPDVQKVAELAQEIEAQWDMFLANTYTLPELQHMDFAQVRLPLEWFAGWLEHLRQLTPAASRHE